jgi:hypothetical protein
MNRKLTFVGSILAFKSKFCEVFDQYKDFGYLLYFRHAATQLIVLIISISLPFAKFYHKYIGVSVFSLPQCILVYF